MLCPPHVRKPSRLTGSGGRFGRPRRTQKTPQAKRFRAELVAHMGRPSTVQRALIGTAVQLETSLAVIDRQFATGAMVAHDSRVYLVQEQRSLRGCCVSSACAASPRSRQLRLPGRPGKGRPGRGGMMTPTVPISAWTIQRYSHRTLWATRGGPGARSWRRCSVCHSICPKSYASEPSKMRLRVSIYDICSTCQPRLQPVAQRPVAADRHARRSG